MLNFNFSKAAADVQKNLLGGNPIKNIKIDFEGVPSKGKESDVEEALGFPQGLNADYLLVLGDQEQDYKEFLKDWGSSD